MLTVTNYLQSYVKKFLRGEMLVGIVERITIAVKTLKCRTVNLVATIGKRWKECQALSLGASRRFCLKRTNSDWIWIYIVRPV